MPYLMQARSSITGAIVTWTSDVPDWEGSNFPGPGSPSYLAVSPPGPAGSDDPNTILRGAHADLVIVDSIARVIT